MRAHVLTRLDTLPLPPASAGEVRLFSVVQDEASRMPYFLDYYRKLGIGRFFFVDNNSQDGTREFLLSQKDCHVFYTKDSFAASGAGMGWTMSLLDLYGEGGWCLVADADELLVYPHCETTDLPAFCSFLDGEGCDAVQMFLLDMYPKGEIAKAVCEPGKKFTDICGYFDRDYTPMDMVHLRKTLPFPPQDMIGGPRLRCFYGDQGLNSYARRLFIHIAERLTGKIQKYKIPFPSLHLKAPTLVKVPLIKWRKGFVYYSSTHQMAPVKLSSVTGALLHFKFFSDFHARAIKAVQSGQHARGSIEYKRYLARLDTISNLMYEGSTLYKDSDGLCALGLMKSATAYDTFSAADETAQPLTKRKIKMETQERQLSLGETLRADARAMGIPKTGFLRLALYLITVPNFLAVFLYRVSSCCAQKSWSRPFAKICWRLNVLVSACDISPKAKIGEGFNLQRALGVVIGHGVVIGRNATLFQHTTMGLRHLKADPAPSEWPVLGDNVTVTAGAVILGAVRIGDGAAIGANAVVLQDVPPGALAVGVPARIVPGKKPDPAFSQEPSVALQK